MRPLTKNERRDATAREAERVCNSGHYLDRLERLAEVLGDRDSVMAVMALRQLHVYCGAQPTGSSGMQYDISMRLLIVAERDHKFTRAQLNRLWYGVHWDAAKDFGLKFPYGDMNPEQTIAMRSNTN